VSESSLFSVQQDTDHTTVKYNNYNNINNIIIARLCNLYAKLECAIAADIF
jgi:hypothetical protein